MYVANNETNLLELSEDDVLSDDVSGNDIESGGFDGSVLSEGSDGEVAESSAGSVAESSDVSQGDLYTDVSGVDNQSTIQTISTDYTEILESIDSGISAVNSVIFLIFIFLLMEWTEKKLLVIVHRFTRERRR